MSEPTDDGRQPDPEPDRGQSEAQQDQGQEQTPETVFNDPTAPVWVDPTTAVPAPPTPPAPAAPTPPGVAPPQGSPPPAPPLSNPYAQQPPAQPYGQPAQPYGQPQPAQPYAAYGQSPYVTGPPAETNTSAVVLTIVSAIVMLSTCFIIGIPSLILGIMALSSNRADAEGSRKKAKTGWILFAANFGVVVILALLGFGLLLAMGPDAINSDY